VVLPVKSPSETEAWKAEWFGTRRGSFMTGVQHEIRTIRLWVVSIVLIAAGMSALHATAFSTGTGRRPAQ
jgi:hypothetical protein